MEGRRGAHVSDDGLKSLRAAGDEDGHQHGDGDVAAELEHLAAGGSTRALESLGCDGLQSYRVCVDGHADTYHTLHYLE